MASNQSAGGPVFSPLEYKAMWDQVVPAMKAVDPTIKVVGPVTTNPISIASGSVDPTIVTTGPNDSSYLDNRDYEAFHASPRATQRALRCATFTRLRAFSAFALEQRYNVTGMHGMSLRWRITKAPGAVPALVVRCTMTR